MYLKSIRADGFKSFADKIEFNLNKGITCIVGPNGSGKSNVLDALRWVLGEQSVKALRGDNSMIDVIFTGSKSRKALSRASVALTFDNSDHYLNSEFNEIEVKRVVYKTGENEYYINNSKVRLKDVTDLFLDSGAGKESFNIISQGAVGDIINSKPIDRRGIFEEAAGVLKYKKRKEESYRKLEKTNENLARVHLLLDELQTTLQPLKEQSKKAQLYLEYKEELQGIEVALIANDITTINDENEQCKKRINELTIELDDLHSNSGTDTTKLEQLKLMSLKLDEDIESKNKELNELSNLMASLESRKQITIERQKYEVEESKLQGNIIDLKEEILSLSNKRKDLCSEIDSLSKELQDKTVSYNELKKKKDDLATSKNELVASINVLNKDLLLLNNKADIIKNNIENDSRMPQSVKSVINNIRLKGIHGVLSKLIDVPEEYVVAIETSLGANNNVVVTDDEKTTKEAINYLKDNKLGRVTFFPLSVIKEREITVDDLKKLKDTDGFVGVASDLVKYDNKYKNVILNQLGNVIVAKDIDSLNNIGKNLNYRYKVVSLEGEVLYSGGAITGGVNRNASSFLNQKYELDNLLEDIKNKEETLKDNNRKLESIDNDLDKSLNEINDFEKKILVLRETIDLKNNNLDQLDNSLKVKQDELNGTQNVLDSNLDKELDDILKEYYDTSNKKENTDKELEKLKEKRFDLNNQINELDKAYRDYNYKINVKQNELKNEEIKSSKMDVKLDNLLLSLNENYSMTYEKAKNEYSLDVPEGTARLTVNNIKAKIKELGDVNTGSIAECERLETRFNFLNTQKDDLEVSVTDLLGVINEMDELMKSKFKETFDKISEEFKKVFKELFKGGEGILKLTDPDDLLNTGIEIEAIPPGKKLNSLALLSGGEKTFTAISLLFAILNVKSVPFVVLDEVEAALDEANVDSFGKYLLTRKEKSQFIIITHKKKVMEYADALYGITMQESGVSKLVSVKLES